MDKVRKVILDNIEYDIEDSRIKTIVWDENSDMNDYKTSGIYICENGFRSNLDDNLPITNVDDYISFKLIVTDSVSDKNGNEYHIIGQHLILTNRGGKETKVYIRDYEYHINNADGGSYIDKGWRPWKEFKQTTNLGQITDEELKSYTDNGFYEGVVFNSQNDLNNMTNLIASFVQGLASDGSSAIPTGTLFTIEVLNNYAICKAAESFGRAIPKTITQKAKIQLVGTIDYPYFEIQRSSMHDTWTPWKAVNKY